MKLGPAIVGRLVFVLAPIVYAAFMCAPLGARAEGSASPATAAPMNAPPASAASAPEKRPVTALFDIDAYDVDGNSLLDEVTVESAVYPFLGPQRTRDDVTNAREALQKAYRDKGYQSVLVEIPPQDARTGIIRLHVVEASIGRLRVVGSRYFLPSQVKEQIPALQEGKVPNFTEAQKEINDFNPRVPSRHVLPLVKPGKVPGTVDVDLKLTDSPPLHDTVEVNNDHSQNTTPLRMTATVTYDNLWQLGHSLSGTALVAPRNLEDAQVYSGSYLIPVWGSPWSVLAYGYDSNSNVVTLGGTNVLGKGYAVGVRGILQLPQPSPDATQAFNFGIDFKHFLENLSLGLSSSGAIVDYFPLTANYTYQTADDYSASTVGFSLTAGLRGLGSSAADFQNKRAFAQANFIRTNLDLQTTQKLDYGMEFGARISGQLANGPLPSSEQFAAGGLTSVRGYLQSEVLGDDGVFASIELRSPSMVTVTNSLFGNVGFIDDWRLYEFTDTAIAWVLNALPGQENTFRIAGVGIGTRLSLLSHFSGSLDVAFPMLKGPATTPRKPYLQFSVKSEL